MKLASMKYADGIGKTKQIQFGGLNHNPGIKDGELYDMRNLTGDLFPLLASRGKRRLYRKLEEPGGIFSWRGLCWVDGTGFYFDGVKRGDVSKGQKVFASMGPYIVVFPDKCYYNVNTQQFGSLESKWSGSRLEFKGGQLYGGDKAANTIKCSGIDWTKWFHEGDAVTVSGCTKHTDNNKTVIIREIAGEELRFYENTFTLDGAEGTAAYTEAGALKIERTVPDLKWVFENENRLWGCTDSTIYASKQSDIFNWNNTGDGLASDAWTLTPESAGYFAGAHSYKGYATFFKEEQISKIYGSMPSNYQATGSATLGLAEGSGRSLAIAGETLFYHGRTGIMAYTGGVPRNVSAELGLGNFKNAVAGTDGLKYFVSMEDADGKWGLYVYDTRQGLWHKEDETHALGFARWDGNLYCLNDKGEIWILSALAQLPADTQEEEAVSWEAEFGDFTEQEPNKKRITKLQLRLELDEGATVQVLMQFDSDGRWQRVGAAIGQGAKRSYYLPIVPRRADHYRLKLTGTGGCRIYSLSIETSTGSQMRSTYGRN